MCGNKSITHTPFREITLQINNKVKSLQNAIQLYFDLGETTNYNCSTCLRNVSAKQIIRIQRPPKTLCIMLNRFEQKTVDNVITFKKLNTKVTYPETLNMEQYAENSTQRIRYRLGSVITHLGDSLEEGHYLATCRVESQNSPTAYYLFDDIFVERIAVNRVLFQQAYLLFYYLDETEQRDDLSHPELITQQSEVADKDKNVELPKKSDKATAVGKMSSDRPVTRLQTRSRTRINSRTASQQTARLQTESVSGIVFIVKAF